MYPVLQIGSLAIQVPGLIFLFGLWLGLTAAERQSARHGIPAETLYDLVFVGLVSGLIGARLAFAAAHPAPFLHSPLGLFSLQPELLDPLGGLVAGGLVALIRMQRRSLSALAVLDSLTPLFAVFLVAYPAANLAGGTGYGAPTSVPWAIDLWGADRHPSQIYELAAAVAIFLFLYTRPDNETPGIRFLNFVVLSAAARLFLEGFRGDSALIGPGIRTVQVVAWIVLAVGLAGLWRLSNRDPDPHDQNSWGRQGR